MYQIKRNTKCQDKTDPEKKEKALFLKFNDGREYSAELKEMSSKTVKLQFE